MAKQSLNVTVTYPAAGHPFKDHDAASTETLASLKTRVLAAFDLSEGQKDGNQVTYVLFKGKQRLADLTVTLGALAGNAGAFSLKLVQQIEQGA